MGLEGCTDRLKYLLLSCSVSICLVLLPCNCFPRREKQKRNRKKHQNNRREGGCHGAGDTIPRPQFHMPYAVCKDLMLCIWGAWEGSSAAGGRRGKGRKRGERERGRDQPKCPSQPRKAMWGLYSFGALDQLF